MRKKPELHIVVDDQGVRSVQLVGPVDSHAIAHDIYLRIRDLIARLNTDIQKELDMEKKLGDIQFESEIPDRQRN